MINTEYIIKRKIVSDAAYNRDSDEEKMMSDDANLRQQQRARQRRRRQYDPKYYDNDSDFESSDDEKNEHSNIYNNIYNPKKTQSFDKIAIFNDVNSNVSCLTLLIQSSAPAFNSSNPGIRRIYSKSKENKNKNKNKNQNKNKNNYRNKYDELERNYSKYARYEPESEHGGSNGGLFHTFILSVYFGQYLSQEAIKLEIIEPWTVGETINKCIEKWKIERPLHKLKSYNSNNYLMRGVEIEMDEIEIEDDVPAFGRHLKIHTLNEKCVGLQYININNNINNNNNNMVMEFKNAKEQILVRVSIPGPNNESHVLAIDKDATALTVRDVISLLNKKKHGAHFAAQYFNFYFDNGKGLMNRNMKRDTLSLAKCIIDLDEPRQLILLPKILKDDDDIAEAYNFNLVRLANETREYHCTKIRNARKNKKRLLTVDRHQIVKKAMDDYNIGTNDHVPIDIISIIDIHICDKDNKQFSIEYRKPQTYGHGHGVRQQIYELETERECKHFVDKVKYLRTLRKLQGI